MYHHQPFVVSKATLYILATPIGNLGDMTTRGLDVLRQVDYVAAEDTRVTRLLLQNYSIKTSLFSLREHNEEAAAQHVINLLRAGHHVAQVSDAGTPAISDPGAVLCRRVREAGFDVVPIPGVSAITAALSVSGFQAAHFFFYGFLPPKSGQRQSALQAIAALPAVLAFYEAPHRIEACLDDLCAVLGPERPAFLAREITKTFETLYQDTLEGVRTFVKSDVNQRKGEFVLLIDAPRENKAEISQADAILIPLLAALPLKQAVQLAAQISAFPRNELYERALQLKQSS